MIQRSLFEVIVVEQKTGRIIGDEKVVATSSEAAMAKTDIMGLCKTNSLTPDDVEYVILKVGSFRPVQETMNTEVSKF